MAKDNHLTEEIHVDHEEHSQPEGYINPDVTLVILTWITFFLLLAILQKFAWKPILKLLDDREKMIRDSVENAQKIQKEMEQLVQTQEEILALAEEKAKAIIEEARKAAVEAAKHIEHKAREEAKIIVENAQREIKEEVEKVRSDLREESARIAVELAEKIIDESLDEKKNKRLIDTYLREL